MTTSQMRIVKARVGVVDGGLAINWGYLNLSRDEFRSLLNEMLEAIGFRPPETVYIDRMPDGKVDWNRIRIGPDELELFGIDVHRAVKRAAHWLSSQAPTRYGLRFEVWTSDGV